MIGFSGNEFARKTDYCTVLRFSQHWTSLSRPDDSSNAVQRCVGDGGVKHWIEKVDFRSGSLVGLLAGTKTLYWNENTVVVRCLDCTNYNPAPDLAVMLLDQRKASFVLLAN